MMKLAPMMKQTRQQTRRPLVNFLNEAKMFTRNLGNVVQSEAIKVNQAIQRTQHKINAAPTVPTRTQQDFAEEERLLREQYELEMIMLAERESQAQDACESPLTREMEDVQQAFESNKKTAVQHHHQQSQEENNHGKLQLDLVIQRLKIARRTKIENAAGIAGLRAAVMAA